MNFTTRKQKTSGDTLLQTLIYVDYESLFYGMYDRFKLKPNLDALLEDLKAQGRFAESIKVFGDFSNDLIKSEQGKIRTITSTIIDCQQPNSDGHKKDYTDFLMLDSIYQDSMTKPHVEQFVLITGDNHYSSVATFLRTQKDKVIGVYAVEGTLGRQLADCSSWVKTIQPKDATEEKYRENLIQCMKSAQDKSIKSTFMNTLNHVTNYYGGLYDMYRRVLSDMIADGQVTQQMEEAADGTQIRTIRLKQDQEDQST